MDIIGRKHLSKNELVLVSSHKKWGFVSQLWLHINNKIKVKYVIFKQTLNVYYFIKLDT